MPRKHREEVAGGIFHVYARGNDKRLIYSDDADRGVYLRILSATSAAVDGGYSRSA